METGVGGPSRGQALVQKLTARCLPGSSDPEAGRRTRCRRLPGYWPEAWPGCCAIEAPLESLLRDKRRPVSRYLLGVSDALKRGFDLGGVGAVVETPSKRLPLTGMSGSCRRFSRAVTTPLSGQLSVPPICLQVPALSHSGAASGLRGGLQWAGISRPWSQSSEGLGAGPGVVAESLGSVSRISFLEGEGANFRLSPPLFPAPQLDWLTFWEIHLPLDTRSWGVPPSGRFRSQGLERPLRLFEQSGVEVATA